MLTLYAFLIFALGSSAIAMPTFRYRQPYEELQLLHGNTDTRLPSGMWGRLVLRHVQPGPARPLTWADGNDCDDFIQFFSPSKFVEKMKIRRVRRLLAARSSASGLEYTYFVQRNKYGRKPTPGLMETVCDDVPVERWARFLDHTYWGREEDIVGSVSDGVMMWKSCLTRFAASLGEDFYPFR